MDIFYLSLYESSVLKEIYIVYNLPQPSSPLELLTQNPQPLKHKQIKKVLKFDHTFNFSDTACDKKCCYWGTRTGNYL